MSQIQVDNIYNKEATGGPNFPLGANVTGVVTATTFKGGAEITSGTISATSVTAASGTFNGPVTIGGTLTYEDVTNIDSVGVITARNGVKVTAGGANIVGVVTATSFVGSGANLTGLSGPTLSFVADGALAAGKPVIVNSVGKAKAIAGVDGVLGASAKFLNGISSAGVGNCKISDTKYAVVYRNTSNVGYVVIATITDVGNSVITYGTPVQFINDCNGACNVVYDDNADRIVIVFKDGNTNHGTYVVGTVTGTSITLGTPAVYLNSSYYPDATYDTANNKVVMIGGNSTSSKVVVGTVASSGNSMTLGSASANYCTNPVVTHIDYHPGTGKCVLSFRDDSDSSKSKAIPVTISGTNATFGTAGEFSPHNTPETDVACIDSTRFVMVGKTEGASSAVMSKVGTIGATAITFGGNGYINNDSGSYITGTKQPIVSFNYNDPANTLRCYYTKDNAVSKADGKITAAGAIVWEVPTAVTNADGSQKYWIAGNFGEIHHTTSISGTARDFISYDMLSTNGAESMVDTYVETNATVGNYIGFSQAAYSDGQTSTISVVGSKIGNQTGLTTGTQYYILPNGNLGTTASTPSIVAGIALNSTQLLIK